MGWGGRAEDRATAGWLGNLNRAKAKAKAKASDWLTECVHQLTPAPTAAARVRGWLVVGPCEAHHQLLGHGGEAEVQERLRALGREGGEGC